MNQKQIVEEPELNKLDPAIVQSVGVGQINSKLNSNLLVGKKKKKKTSAFKL